jgi:N-acetylglutamate synthase-like GNAT family acetyltransferase
MGGICCLGVREDMRQKGVGLVLAAYATEKLKSRKVGNIFVGYTWLVDWYGKLGYKVWHQYKMSWKKL